MVQAGRIEAWGEWAGTAACSCTTVCSRENERGQFVDRGAAATLVIGQSPTGYEFLSNKG